MEVLMGASFGIAATAQDSHARLYDGAIAKDSSPDESPETSSSIGAPDDSDEEEDDDDNSEAQSKFRGGSLASLDSLDDALPVKRGLSNHFSGKSKSFASLADVCTVRDLKKTENPLNKRRRMVIASKWSKKAFYSWSNPKSMPLLALNEDEEDESRDQVQEERHDQDRVSRLSRFQEKRMTSFRTRCFSLADLQEHSLMEDEADEDDDDDEEEDGHH